MQFFRTYNIVGIHLTVICITNCSYNLRANLLKGAAILRKNESTDSRSEPATMPKRPEAVNTTDSNAEAHVTEFLSAHSIAQTATAPLHTDPTALEAASRIQTPLLPDAASRRDERM